MASSPNTGISPKIINPAVYRDETAGNVLFVPTLTMWEVRKTNNREAVCKRAGIDAKTAFTRWHKKYGKDHWFWNYLYGKPDANPGVKLVYDGSGYRPESTGENGFCFIDDDAVQFRKFASLEAVCKLLRKQRKQRERSASADKRGSVHAQTIYHFLDRLADFPDARDWQLHNGELLPNVTVASAADIRRCADAWHYTAIQNTSDVSENAYREFFDHFPIGQFGQFVRWLYGGPDPNDCYVIPQEAFQLKCRLSPAGIEKAAGIGAGKMKQWQERESTRLALDDATEASMNCSRPEFIERELNEKSQAWNNLDAEFGSNSGRVKEAIIRYATKAAWASAFVDVGMAPNRKSNKGWMKWAYWKRCCRKVGGTELETRFEEYVRTPRKFDEARGIVGPGLFVPAEAMIRFRRAARKLWSKQRIGEIERRLPAQLFAMWFLDWAVPGKNYQQLAFSNENQLLTAKPLRDDSVPQAEPGYLGLIVDTERKEIRRKGIDAQPIELARSDVMWHIFNKCFEASGKQLSVEGLESDYPGGNTDGRKRMTNHLNKKLTCLGVKIKNRRLVSEGVTSGVT